MFIKCAKCGSTQVGVNFIHRYNTIDVERFKFIVKNGDYAEMYEDNEEELEVICLDCFNKTHFTVDKEAKSLLDGFCLTDGVKLELEGPNS